MSKSVAMSSRWRSYVAGAASLLVGAAGTLHGDDLFLDRINTDRIALQPVVTRVRTDTPARRVMVLVIDGLRDDVAFELPVLKRIEQRGFMRTAYADFPSYTYPGLVTIATGVHPALSGVRLNWEGPDPPLDSVSRRAADAGFDVTISSGGFEPFWRLMLPPNRARSVAADDVFRPSELRALHWVYFGGVDAAGHRFGAVSDEYLLAASEANELVERALASLDLDKDVLIVVSDHGHVDEGGHGGIEPDALRGVWAAAGVGVRRSGRVPPSPLRDVASTLAVLLGAELPRHTQGRPALDVVIGSQTFVSENTVDAIVAQRPPAPVVLRRTIVAFVIGLLAALMIAWFAKLRARDFTPTIVHSVTFLLLYLIAGYRWSWTIPRGYGGFLIETALFSAIGIVGALWVARRERQAEEALALALFHGLPYLTFAAYVGLDPRWMPSPFAGWGVVLLATIQFYVGLFFGARAIWPELRSSVFGSDLQRER